MALPVLKERSARGLVEAARETILFAPGRRRMPATIPSLWVPGRGRLVVVLGPNAAGKSLFRRVIGGICGGSSSGNRIEFIGLSQEFRQCGGVATAFVYGDESWEASGAISANSVVGGIVTCRGRMSDHVIFWDEPDLGLSDEYAAGAGVEIADFALDMPEHTLAAFVVTHRAVLVRELLRARPHYLYIGSGRGAAPASIRAWLGRPIRPAKLETLRKEGTAHLRAFARVLDQAKKRKA
jgi:hypothetical protein